MGGPALHVSYLDARPRDARLPDDARRRRARAGRELDGVRRRGARRRGGRREAPPPRDLAGHRHALGAGDRAADQAGAAAHPAHAHGEGRRGRPHRGARSRATRGRRSSSTPSTGTCCAATSTRCARQRSARSSGAWPGVTTRLVAVSPEVRDDLVELGVAPAEKFSVIRLGIDLDARIIERQERRGAAAAPVRRSRQRLRRRVDRPDDGDQAAARRRSARSPGSASAGSRRSSAWSATAPTASSSSGARTSSASPATCSSSATSATSRRTTGSSTRCCSRRGTKGRRSWRSSRSPPGRPWSRRRSAAFPTWSSDGTDGFLTPVGDVEAIAAALERLARNPQLGVEMGRAGRERTLPRYRVERLIDDVDALYRVLLAEKGLPLPEPTSSARARAT